MLVLAPAMCILGGIGVSGILNTYMRTLDFDSSKSSGGSSGSNKKKKEAADDSAMRSTVSAIVIGAVTLFLVLFAWHSSWVTSEAYSSPSIVLAANQGDGSRKIFDDFREAYYWLRQNTDHNAKVRRRLRRLGRRLRWRLRRRMRRRLRRSSVGWRRELEDRRERERRQRQSPPFFLHCLSWFSLSSLPLLLSSPRCASSGAP